MNLSHLLLSAIVLLFVHCSFVSTTITGDSYFARPIADTCGILGCQSDLTFPPCWNSTHEGEKGEMGDHGDKGTPGDNGKDGLAGERGENGEKGKTGLPGERGLKGEKGEKGDIGDPGDPGDNGRVWQGYPGKPGDVGLPGPRGPQGPPGCVGDQGEQGPTGLQGEQGPMGLPGQRGLKGEQGPTGDQGPEGRPGARGATGPLGPRGDRGDIGPKGQTGMQGERGSLGPRGPKGPPPRVVNGKNLAGPPGPSGEDVQCPKLVTIKGEMGDKGPQGPQGKKGPTGQRGRTGLIGKCMFTKINFMDIIFPPEMYGDRGARGLPSRGIRGEPGDAGTCDDSVCHCKKNCLVETEVVYEECKIERTCRNPLPVSNQERMFGERGPKGPRGLKGDPGLPGFGLKGQQGPRGPTGDSWPEDKLCECCPDCLRFANTETYAVHSISPSAVANCYGDDQEIYRGYSLMHYASYSPSPSVSQDLSDIGSCIPNGKENDFTAVPFQSCSSSEEKCRFAERRPVVIWLSNSTDNVEGGPMLNAIETSRHLSRCVACRSRGGVFFVNHTLSKETPTCPDSGEMWKMRYGGLARWQWKLRYTGLSWVMYQSNDVQGGNMLHSPGSCLPGDFSNTLFYECQGPDRCYNKFGEFKNFWMMNADEANKRFYGLNTSTPSTTPTGKYRREDVSPLKDSAILGKCAVCELVPPECTSCRMPDSTQNQLDTSTIEYVIHSQKAGNGDIVPKCSQEVNPSDDDIPLRTGYSLMQISDQKRGVTVTDLGEPGSCVANFDSANVVRDGAESSSATKQSVWLAGRKLVGEEEIDLSDAPKKAASRCAVCASRYPVVVVHSAADDAGGKPPACPDPRDVVLWHGFSLLSLSRQQNLQQNTLSTSTGSCLQDITDGACALECSHDDKTCRASHNNKCNWSLRKNHPMVESILREGKLSNDHGDFDWTLYMSRCTVCAVRSATM